MEEKMDLKMDLLKMEEKMDLKMDLLKMEEKKENIMKNILA